MKGLTTHYIMEQTKFSIQNPHNYAIYLSKIFKFWEGGTPTTWYTGPVPQSSALRFVDGKISWVSGWVTVFSPTDISELRRSKNIKFITKVASSTRMMCTRRVFKKVFFNCGKICKKCLKRQTVQSTRTLYIVTLLACCFKVQKGQPKTVIFFFDG